MVLSREKGLSEDVSSRGLAQAVDDHLALSINVGNVRYYEWFYTCRAVTKLKEADQSSWNLHRGRCSKVNRTVVGKNRSRGLYYPELNTIQPKPLLC